MDRNDRTDKDAFQQGASKGFEASQNRADQGLISHDKDSSALQRQQGLNEAKQRSGGAGTEAGIRAEFGDNRQADSFGGANFSRDSTQLSANQGLSRDQGYQSRAQAQTGDLGISHKGHGDLAYGSEEGTNPYREVGGTDHLQYGWARAPDTRATDRAANTMSSNQMGANSNSLGVGGTDHLQQQGWDSGAETRDFQTDKTANALRSEQMAGYDRNSSNRNTMNPDKEVGGTDHLQARWDKAPDIRDFQTDKSANALSSNQRAGADMNASYQNSSNPRMEVGGTDHLARQGWDSGAQAQALGSQANRAGAQTMSTEQLASNASNVNYGTSANKPGFSDAQSSQKEVGGTDHMSAQGQAGFDSQAQNRNLRS
jgi:hypothetical protein